MSTNTFAQAKALADDLKTAKGTISWQIGKVINALLESAKQEHPDNIALAQLDPLNGQAGHIVGMSADDVRAIVGQIVAATRPAPTVALPAASQRFPERF